MTHEEYVTYIRTNRNAMAESLLEQSYILGYRRGVVVGMFFAVCVAGLTLAVIYVV
jgi:hypothetical protein